MSGFTCPIAQAAGSVHCQWCREHAGDGFPVTCPDGFTNDKLPVGLGDVIEKLAKPVAKLLGLDCLDVQGKLKPTSPCGKRKTEKNRVRLF